MGKKEPRQATSRNPMRSHSIPIFIALAGFVGAAIADPVSTITAAWSVNTNQKVIECKIQNSSLYSITIEPQVQVVTRTTSELPTFPPWGMRGTVYPFVEFVTTPQAENNSINTAVGYQLPAIKLEKSGDTNLKLSYATANPFKKFPGDLAKLVSIRVGLVLDDKVIESQNLKLDHGLWH